MLLIHCAVKQEVGGQGLVTLAEQERLDAAVAVEAQRLQPLYCSLFLLRQVHCNCAGWQPCHMHANPPMRNGAMHSWSGPHING